MKVSRQEAISILDEGCEELVGIVRQLPDEIATKSGTLGGGEWSAKDLLGHIETWERVALETLEDLQGGRPARIDETVKDVASMDAFNAREVSAKAARSLQDALAAHDDVHRRLVSSIEALTDEEWTTQHQDGEGSARTLAERLGSNTGSKGSPFGHVYAHLDDLRALGARQGSAGD